jgi:hypothetical protein
MSEPNGRYGDTQDFASPPGGPLPGQPLSEQPTQVVHPFPSDPRFDTVRSVPAYPLPQPVADGRSDDPLDDVAEWEDDGTATRPDYRDAPVVVRRADTLAGLLLVLAGIAAGVSLLVVWVHGGGTGLDLVRDGVRDLDHPQRLADQDAWEAPAIVAGGVVLFLLGLLMYVPAKTHRLLGVLALLVSLVVAAGVLVPLAAVDWDVRRWAVGFWFAAVVGGLGFLGAVKALSTHPRSRQR